MRVSVVSYSWFVYEKISELKPASVTEDVGVKGLEFAVFIFHFLVEKFLFADLNWRRLMFDEC